MTNDLWEDLYMLVVQMRKDGVPVERQWLAIALIFQWLVWDVLKKDSFNMIATGWGECNLFLLEPPQIQ